MLLTPSTIGAIQQDPLRRTFKQASLDLRFAETKSLVDATTGTNLIDFTRASSGTYVGSDGLIKTATTNLLLRSEELTNSVWTSTMSAGVTVTLDNAQGSPYSGTNAYRIDFTAENQNGAQQVFTFIAGIAYFASIWVKGTAGETIRFAGKAGQSAETFTLTGNWQRLLVGPFTATGGSASFNLNTFGSTTARTVYATAAQLEQSSTVGEYVKTTSTINSAPRFDHDPTTGESLGLLVEESRTNLLLRSEELDDAAWATNNASISTDSTLSPNGQTSADSLIENTANAQHNANQTVALPDSTVVTVSVYAKSSGRNWMRLSVIAKDGTFPGAYFDLSTGSTGTVVSSPIATSITSVGNDWYRCSVTASTSSGATLPGLRIWTASANNTLNYTGDGTSGIYIWGAQLEKGSFPTSYIPTEGSTVTRAADVASITGTNFSSWYRQDEGTFFAEVDSAMQLGATNIRILQASDGTGANRQDLAFSSGTLLAFVNTANSVQVNAVTVNSAAANANARLAYAYKQDDFAWTLDAGAIKDDPTGTLPTVDRLGIGQRLDAAGYLNGHIKRLTYWGQRLPNETLQTITQ